MIELKNITKTFQEGETTHIVLQEITQTIHQNEIIVLLGRSGSGKSTLLNLISGIDLPSSGDLLINNKIICTAFDVFTEQNWIISCTNINGRYI